MNTAKTIALAAMLLGASAMENIQITVDDTNCSVGYFKGKYTVDPTAPSVYPKPPNVDGRAYSNTADGVNSNGRQRYQLTHDDGSKFPSWIVWNAANARWEMHSQCYGCFYYNAWDTPVPSAEGWTADYSCSTVENKMFLELRETTRFPLVQVEGANAAELTRHHTRSEPAPLPENPTATDRAKYTNASKDYGAQFKREGKRVTFAEDAELASVRCYNPLIELENAALYEEIAALKARYEELVSDWNEEVARADQAEEQLRAIARLANSPRRTAAVCA